jgi:hypothetical protein
MSEKQFEKQLQLHFQTHQRKGEREREEGGTYILFYIPNSL